MAFVAEKIRPSDGIHHAEALEEGLDPWMRRLARPNPRSDVALDWPRGRIVFDQTRDLFILYADRKLLTPATIARIETQFHMPADRTEVQSDLHYQRRCHVIESLMRVRLVSQLKSCGGDDFAPRLHGRCPEGSVRSC